MTVRPRGSSYQQRSAFVLVPLFQPHEWTNLILQKVNNLPTQSGVIWLPKGLPASRWTLCCSRSSTLTGHWRTTERHPLVLLGALPISHRACWVHAFSTRLSHPTHFSRTQPANKAQPVKQKPPRVSSHWHRWAVVNIWVFRQLLYIVHMALQMSLHHTSKLRTKRKTELGYVGNWGFGVSYHPLPSLQLLLQSLLTSITFLPVFKARWICTKDLAAPQGVNCSSKHFRRHRSVEVWVTAGIGSVI